MTSSFASVASSSTTSRHYSSNNSPASSSLSSSPSPFSTLPANSARSRPRIVIPPSRGGAVVSVPKTRSRHTAPATAKSRSQQQQHQQSAPNSSSITTTTTSNYSSHNKFSLSTMTSTNPFNDNNIPTPISPQSQPTSIIHAFPSRLSNTTVYIVIDPVTEEAAIINPVLDLDPLTNEIRTRHADRLLKFISDEGLTVKWILETALHVDRISACRYLQLQLQFVGDGVVPKVCVGENVFCTCGDDDDEEAALIESASSPTTTVDSRTTTNSSAKSPEAFDHLFADGEAFHLGNIIASASHLEGHDGGEYIVGNNVFGSAGVRIQGEGSKAGKGIVHHAEPPPDKTQPGNNNRNGSVSSRQAATIDEVLGSASTATTTGENKVSPMLAFYAEQVNTRGGRIPKKINLPTALRRKMSGGEGGGEVVNGNGKGKERDSSGGGQQGQLSASPSILQQQLVQPLRIPRKLGGIMC